MARTARIPSSRQASPPVELSRVREPAVPDAGRRSSRARRESRPDAVRAEGRPRAERTQREARPDSIEPSLRSRDQAKPASAGRRRARVDRVPARDSAPARERAGRSSDGGLRRAPTGQQAVKRPRKAKPRQRGRTRTAPQAAPPGLELWIRLADDFGRYAQAVSRELHRLNAGGVDAKEIVTRLSTLGREYLQGIAELPAELAAQWDQGRRRSSAPRRFGRVID